VEDWLGNDHGVLLPNVNRICGRSLELKAPCPYFGT
jgi:hypothetical protein